MFRRVRQTLDNANYQIANAGHLIGLAKDFVLDLQDGFGVTVIPKKGFSVFINKLLMSLVNAVKNAILMRDFKLDLTWMEDTEIPFMVKLDPTVDVLLPGHVKLAGGPWDGKTIKPKELTEELRLNPPQPGDPVLIYKVSENDKQVYNYVV